MNAVHFVICGVFLLIVLRFSGGDATLPQHRIRRDDENGRGGNDSDGSGATDSSVNEIPTVASLIPLRFKFLTTTDDAQGGLYYSARSVPAMELAVRHINANATILPRYNLSYDFEQLKCSSEEALDVFFQDVFSRDSIVSFLGSACPQAAQSIAELVHRWNITEILSSPLETGSSEERAPTPNLLRLYPRESSVVPVLLSLCLRYHWTRLLVISGAETKFEIVFNAINRNLTHSNISLAHRQLDYTPIFSTPDLLGEEEDYRIIFLNTNPTAARQILCEAYHRGHMYPFYSWILYGWYEPGWWRYNATETSADAEGARNCSDAEIAHVLDNSISLRVYPMPINTDMPTVAGITYSQFNQQCFQHLGLNHPHLTSYTRNFISPLTYDAVWALALALHRVDTAREVQLDADVIPTHCGATRNTNQNLGLFNYSNSFLGCRIKEELLASNFTGISGMVSFNEDGTRHTTHVTLLQYRVMIDDDDDAEVNEVEFAQFDLAANKLVYSPGESNTTLFPEGLTPDGSPRNETLTFHLALTVTYYTISTIGVVFTFLCLAFNIKYRNTRVVKLTSPTINYFLIVGAFMMFSSIYIRVLPVTGELINHLRCNLQAWINTIAYCFGYGTILTKLVRVYQIFHNPTPNKKKIGVKDWHMIAIVALITGVGVLLLIIGTAFLRPNPALLPSTEYGPGKDELRVTINYYAWQCYGGKNKAPFYFLLFIYSYLGLLQLFGLVLAIRTRKVKISILNDSKYITAIVYVSSLVVVVMMLVTFVSGNLQNINEGFFSAGLILSTYIFLGLIFIPKMISYYRDPKGENMMRDLTSAQGAQLQSSGVVRVKNSERERIGTLERRVTELEVELNTYKVVRPTDIIPEEADECYSNNCGDGSMASPATTFSQISSGSLSQSVTLSGSFVNSARNGAFDLQQSSLESGGGGGFTVARAGTVLHGGFLKSVQMVEFKEFKPSPLTKRVSFSSMEGQIIETSEMDSPVKTTTTTSQQDSLLNSRGLEDGSTTHGGGGGGGGGRVDAVIDVESPARNSATNRHSSSVSVSDTRHISHE